MEESSSHAMNSVIDIETIEPKKKLTLEKQETKVNLSATNEMNPYLLLIFLPMKSFYVIYIYFLSVSQNIGLMFFMFAHLQNLPKVSYN